MKQKESRYVEKETCCDVMESVKAYEGMWIPCSSRKGLPRAMAFWVAKLAP